MRRVRLVMACLALVAPLIGTLAGTASAVPASRSPASSISGGPEGISCPTTEWCAAVGTVETGTVHSEEVLEPGAWIFADGRWTHRLLPMPAGVGRVPEASTASVSCPSAGSCVAVGTFYAPGRVLRIRLFTETLSGGRWTVDAMGWPKGARASIFATPGNTEPTISCPSLTACTVVDAVARPDFFFAVPAVWRLRGTQWTSRILPSPPGTTRGNRIAILRAVSCPDPGDCVAVGYHQDRAHRMVPLVESYSRGRWTATDGLVAGRDSAYLDGVDCPAAGACKAVGFIQDIPDSAVQHPVVVTLRGGHWALHVLPLPRAVDSAAFNSVSCPTPASCTAVGFSDERTLRPYAERLTAGRWHPDSPAIRIPLDVVSCPSATHCLSTTGLSTPGRDCVDTRADGRWTSRSVGLPGPADLDGR